MRLKNLQALMMMALAVSLLLFAFADQAQAASAAYDGVKDTCEDIREQIGREDKDGIYLVESIVTCIKAVIVGSDKYSVTGVFEIFIKEIYGFFAPIIQIALTLSVALFGVLLLAGMIEKPSRDGFVALIKIASVVYFVQVSTAQWLFDSSLDALDGMTDTVFTFGKSGGFDGRCEIQDGDVLWDRIDCMMDVLIGIRQEDPAIPSGTTNVSPDKSGISRGMMHFFFANMSSSGMGAVIGLLGMYTVFTFIFAVIKSLHTYLAAVLGLAFLLVLTPMFIPFILFKATRNYFDKWYRIAISFILQPVLLFGFLSLMLVAFDTVLVSGNNSVLRMIMGDEAKTMVLSDALEKAGVYNQQRFLEQGTILSRAEQVSQQFSDTLGGSAEGYKATPQGTSIRDGSPIPGVNVSYLPMDGVDYEKLASKMKSASDSAEATEQLGYAAILLALTCFVFLSMLNYIPVMATDLAGGVFEVPNLYENVGQKFLGADQFENAAYKFSKAARDKIKNEGIIDSLSSLVGRRS